MSSVFEGRRLDFNIEPSLKHLCLVQTTLTLWNQDDIKALIAKRYPKLFAPYYLKHKWRILEKKVEEKARRLPLTESLKDEVIGFIKPIGVQLYGFFKAFLGILCGSDYVHTCRFVLKNLSKVSWTCRGTIDQEKTAEVIMRDENLEIENRYLLACIYCFEDEIPLLWNQVGRWERYNCYFMDCQNPENPYRYQYMLVVLWTSFLKGKIDYSNGFPYQYAFQCAALGAYKVACKRLSEKLTPVEQEQILLPTANLIAEICLEPYEELKFADVLCFLVSQMAKEQQDEFLMSYSCQVLECLLYWPWSDSFLETAEHTWDFLSDCDRLNVLQLVVKKVTDGYSDCNYQQFFKTLWLRSSDAQKIYATDLFRARPLFSLLFKAQDGENIRMVLRDMPISKREEFIFSFFGRCLCLEQIHSDVECRWDLLGMFFALSLSTDGMIEFKNMFMKRFQNNDCGYRPAEFYHSTDEVMQNVNGDRMTEFYHLIDDVIRKVNKRRTVELENPSLKRLCDASSDEPTCGIHKESIILAR